MRQSRLSGDPFPGSEIDEVLQVLHAVLVAINGGYAALLAGQLAGNGGAEVAQSDDYEFSHTDHLSFCLSVLFGCAVWLNRR